MDDLTSTVALFNEYPANLIYYAAESDRGATMLCATISDLSAQLQSTLWRQTQPIILTSGTLAVGRNFRRFREETGLLTTSRVSESVSPSPFNYRENCLLYLPQVPPEKCDEDYYAELADQITDLLRTTSGHALVLFTSYAAMSAVKERLAAERLAWPLFTMGRNAVHTTEKFKAHPGSILLATGPAWEGFDFPGDCVSLLIIPRLPFPRPDALKEKEKVPEMQIKLKQGFGRAIRTETDTCIIAILDDRASPGKRYYTDITRALPRMPMTNDLLVIKEFIHKVKTGDYFMEGSS